MHSIYDDVTEHCWRDLALCTLVKHQPTLLSDRLAVVVWIVYDVVAVYGVHTHGFSLVCDGVNLHDRDKAACECVSVFLSTLFMVF